jgi:FkbM family methyltransferase
VRSPRKSLLWLADEARHLLGADVQVTLRPGWTLRSHPAAFRGAYYAQVNDPVQIREFDGFLASLTPGTYLLDLGAHFGAFSLAALHYGGPEARALAVDPSPQACRMMRIQGRLNGLADRFSVVQAAVSDHSGTETMVAIGVLADGYFAVPAKGLPAPELTLTEAITVDDLVGRMGRLPTHIKIDVEGAEAAVLRGAKHTLSRAPAPLLFVEFHNALIRQRQADPSESVRLLHQAGYRVYSTEGVELDEAALLAADLVRTQARRS